MKIIAACMVANEADIIEPFVRHHTQLLDALVVLNHRSIDRTPEIVAALAREGLPVVLLHDAERAFRQAERMTYLAKRYLGEMDADFCFLLDADEFVRCESRSALVKALAALPAGAQGLVATQHAPIDGVTLAHFPVRSPEQIAKKAVIGWLAHRMSETAQRPGDEDRQAPAWHWRQVFSLMRCAIRTRAARRRSPGWPSGPTRW